MDRNASGSVIAELEASKNQPIHLVEFVFDAGDGGSVYLTDAYRDIIWNGNNYLRTGHFLGISEIEESLELNINTVSISLSGVEQSWIAAFLSRNYIDRQVKVHLAFLNTVEGVITSPILIFDGRMDGPVINDNPNDGTCEIVVSVASQFIDFNRVSGRLTNHEDQQIYFPGDKGFEFASEMVKEIVWGRNPNIQRADSPFLNPDGTANYTNTMLYPLIEQIETTTGIGVDPSSSTGFVSLDLPERTPENAAAIDSAQQQWQNGIANLMLYYQAMGGGPIPDTNGDGLPG
jgi:hypothetical protein